MHNTLKLLLLIVSILSFLITGCGENVQIQNPFAKQKAQPATPTVTQQTQPVAPVKQKLTKEEEALKIMFRSGSMRKGSSSLTRSGVSSKSPQWVLLRPWIGLIPNSITALTFNPR